MASVAFFRLSCGFTNHHPRGATSRDWREPSTTHTRTPSRCGVKYEALGTCKATEQRHGWPASGPFSRLYRKHPRCTRQARSWRPEEGGRSLLQTLPVSCLAYAWKMCLPCGHWSTPSMPLWRPIGSKLCRTPLDCPGTHGLHCGRGWDGICTIQR